MRRFYIEPDQINGQTAEITGTEARHLKTVLRMQPGDLLELVDGSGYAYECRIQSINEDQIQVEVLGRNPAAAESPLELCIALGFLKDKKMDLLVRHLTELGISRFIPLWTARAVARPPEKRIASRMERWQSIAKEAVKQSQRGRMPEIVRPLSFNEALEIGSQSDKRLLFWEQADAALPPKATMKQSASSVFVLLGPEGGFTEKEARTAVDKGFSPLSMGPRILRAETAAITACALIQYLFGDMGQKSP